MFEPERCAKVIGATMILHNMCELNGIPILGEDVNVNEPQAVDLPEVVNQLAEGQQMRNRLVRGHFNRRL